MKKKVLVVDDSATVRSLHGYIFKSHGFDVETACNGVEAIEKLYSSSDIAVVVPRTLCDGQREPDIGVDHWND